MLIFAAGYYGLRGKAVAERADMLLERFGLTSHAHLEYTKISGGQKRRLSLARALIHQPKLLILDEPTAGVDVELRIELWRWLRDAQRRRAHDLSHDALSGGGRRALPAHRDRAARPHRHGEADARARGRGGFAAGRLLGADAQLTPSDLWTLVKREIIRSLKIINQVIWPPIITTLLYVFVFGLAIGSRIPSMQGVTYAQFLIPGLIMLQVIDASYGECSSSLFQGRFMNSIQELLIAPMSAGEIVAGYVLGSSGPRVAHRRAHHRDSVSSSCIPRRTIGRCTSASSRSSRSCSRHSA